MIGSLLTVPLLVLLLPALLAVLFGLVTVVLGTITAAAGAWYELVHPGAATNLLYATTLLVGNVMMFRHLLGLRKTRARAGSPF